MMTNGEVPTMRDDAVLRTDLNLLVVLHALLSERSVSRAAARIHRSQSATSHALARLRTVFDDPLLVRVGSEMIPTSLAREIEPTLAGLMHGVGEILEPGDAFDPTTSETCFAVALPDFVPGLAAAVAANVAGAGAGLRLELTQARPGVLDRVVGRGLDLAVTFGGASRAGLASEPALTVPWTVCLRRDHPLADRLTPADWADGEHVVIGASLDSGVPDRVDRAAAELGLPPRRIRMAVATFDDLARIVASTDTIATVPESALTAPDPAIVRTPPPFPIPPIELALYWSTLADREPRSRWIRTAAATELAAHRLDRPR